MLWCFHYTFMSSRCHQVMRKNHIHGFTIILVGLLSGDIICDLLELFTFKTITSTIDPLLICLILEWIFDGTLVCSWWLWDIATERCTLFILIFWSIRDKYFYRILFFYFSSCLINEVVDMLSTPTHMHKLLLLAMTGMNPHYTKL